MSVIRASFVGPHSFMAKRLDVKRNGNKKKRNEKRSKHQATSSKNATRPSDVYEAEENDPQEELKAGQRYDVIAISGHCLCRTTLPLWV